MAVTKISYKNSQDYLKPSLKIAELGAQYVMGEEWGGYGPPYFKNIFPELDITSFDMNGENNSETVNLSHPIDTKYLNQYDVVTNFGTTEHVQDQYICWKNIFDMTKLGGIIIGAHDGESGSNSLFLEKHRNWSGICIEPGPAEYKKLEENRTSINVNCCVSDYDGESEFTYIEGYSNMLSGLSENYNNAHSARIDNEVNSYGGKIEKIIMPVFKLQTLLDKHKILDIDYCSIDTEGTEYNIVTSIDFNKTNIKMFSIENNYGDNKIQLYLESKGYYLLTKLQWDDIFVKKDI